MSAAAWAAQGIPRAGGPDHIVWSADGNSLILSTAREGRANLIRVEIASAKISEVTKGNQAVEGFRATKDASAFGRAYLHADDIGDLFWIIRAQTGAQPRQLTDINDKLLSHSTYRAGRDLVQQL